MTEGQRNKRTIGRKNNKYCVAEDSMPYEQKDRKTKLR